MARIGYYPDGVTKITAPFYQCVCRECLCSFWGLVIDSKCPQCKSDNVFRSFSKEEADAELALLKESK